MKSIILSSAKLKGQPPNKLEMDIENGRIILDDIMGRYIMVCDVSDEKYEWLVDSGLEFEIFEEE